ncbi:MAG: transglycosylase SLT domain-containing protein [Bacteroidales bacterium]|nr:transglycosylase SLT domain-containing protein [Bacteroidales bacterium]MCB9013206.1 transglycosylase SLT domain-containing protein [Bacteroidales bacterium]
MTFFKKTHPSLKIVVPVLAFFLFMAVYFISGLFASDKSNDPDHDPRSKYAVFSFDIPEDVYFAGEKVPLDQIDILESLDRELLVNTYWQSQTLLFIKRANRYFPVIEPILKEYGVPDDFKYLAVAESGLTNAVSPSNAVGFWQLLEGTAKDYGLEVNSEVDERYNLEKSTEAACKYLLESHRKYVNWTLTAASYNAGRKGVDKQIERQKELDYYDLLLGDETGRYVYRILSYKLIMENPTEYGFILGENHLYPEIPFFEVTVEGSVPDIAEFAKRYGISYKILKWMNPWLREAYLNNPSGKTYYFKIPKEGYFKMSNIDKAVADSIG